MLLISKALRYRLLAPSLAASEDDGELVRCECYNVLSVSAYLVHIECS